MGGFFSTASKQACITDIFYGTDYLSHLGTKRGGIATFGPDGFSRSIHSLENSYFRNKFEPLLDRFKGNLGIGVISDTDSQPLIINCHLGKFALVTVGRINNLEELTQRSLGRNTHFCETAGGFINPTELVASLICEGDSFEAGIENVIESVKGSCSLLLLTENGIYVARDKLGRTPIIIGKKDGAFAASSESSCFPNLGYETDYYVGPGEILLMTADGYQQLRKPGDKMQVCSFLWVYYGYPTSSYEGINVEAMRYKNGQLLAKNDDAQADMVAGIPDSGIGHAIGYSHESGIPYMRPYCKYTPTWPRSFMPQNQEMRDLVASMKLIPNKALIEDKSIIFSDDSIVRGTQLKDNVSILHEYGAREIHMRIACPVLIHPCEFLNFSTSRSTLDLAGRKAIKQLEGAEDAHLEDYACDGSQRQCAMVDCIRERLSLTTLKFQKLDDLVEAIGLPKEKLCTHCWDGSSYF